MKLTADKTKLQLSVNADLSAMQFETLISDLAELRANMEPPVPMERPTSPDQRVSMQDDPSVMAIPLKDGRTRFWIRNHGIGWLVYNFTVQQSISLREFFISNTPDDDGSPNLFRDDGTDRGPGH